MSKLNLSFELVEEDSVLNSHSDMCLQVDTVTTTLKDHNLKKVKFVPTRPPEDIFSIVGVIFETRSVYRQVEPFIFPLILYTYAKKT